MGNDIASAEAVRGIRSGIAGSGGVTKNRFSLFTASDNKITVVTSGFASGITQETAAEGKQTSQKYDGEALLEVNAQSVNIAAGDPIKPTTGGVGLKAATNKDKYSAIALDASTTDGDVIRVQPAHGYCNI